MFNLSTDRASVGYTWTCNEVEEIFVTVVTTDDLIGQPCRQGLARYGELLKCKERSFRFGYTRHIKHV